MFSFVICSSEAPRQPEKENWRALPKGYKRKKNTCNIVNNLIYFSWCLNVMVESSLHVNVLLFISCRIIFVTKKVGRARAFLSDLVNREKEIQKIPLVFSIISLELQAQTMSRLTALFILLVVISICAAKSSKKTAKSKSSKVIQIHKHKDAEHKNNKGHKASTAKKHDSVKKESKQHKSADKATHKTLPADKSSNATADNKIANKTTVAKNGNKTQGKSYQEF